MASQFAHAFFSIVKKAIAQSSISFKEINYSHMLCLACQVIESHRLPYESRN